MCSWYVTGLTPEGVHQAFHAQLMLHSQIARTAGVSLTSIDAEALPTLPEPLHSTARNMWLASAVDVHVSKLQTDVSNALLLAGIPNSMEWLTEDGLFSIDIAFQVDGQPVAVEVDGSHHYTNSMPQIPLSEVLVRKRLLQVGVWGPLHQRQHGPMRFGWFICSASCEHKHVSGSLLICCLVCSAV